MIQQSNIKNRFIKLNKTKSTKTPMQTISNEMQQINLKI